LKNRPNRRRKPMNTVTKLALEDIRDALEELERQLPKMGLKNKVDVAAHMRSVIKSATNIDEAVKAEIKIACKYKPGTVFGEAFKAVMGVFSVTRLNAKKVEVEYPRVFAKCLETAEQARITFTVR
jgi:hypothetical protein